MIFTTYKRWKHLFSLLCIIFLGIVSYVLQPQENIHRKIVEYDYTVDGDTIYLIEDGTRQKYRLLMVDCPEATSEIEPYGLEATTFTKTRLENASGIEIEYEKENETDMYGRSLVWVYVDGKLLQEELARVGLVEQLYTGSFRYEKEVREALDYAKTNFIGIYKKD